LVDDIPSHKWLGYFQSWLFEFENRAVKQLNGRANSQAGNKIEIVWAAWVRASL